MAKSKLVKANEKVAEKAAFGKIENTVVDGYTKVENAFVDRYLTRDGETGAGGSKSQIKSGTTARKVKRKSAVMRKCCKR